MPAHARRQGPPRSTASLSPSPVRHWTARLPGPPWRRALALSLLGWVLACAPSQGRAPVPVPAVEQAYLSWRHDADRVDLLDALAADTTPDGLPAATARQRESASRNALARLLAAAAPRNKADSAALQLIWHSVAPDRPDPVGEAAPGCLPAGPNATPERLTSLMMACYQLAANTIVVDGDTLNRLAILGLLPQVPDRDQRKRLFLALDPVWRSINGDNTPDSPYRAMLRAHTAAWGDSLSPVDAKAPAYGVPTARFEAWLEAALTRYRALLPDSLVEPWDWYYQSGEASRRLSPRLPGLPDLRRVNDAYFTTIGASPEALRIRYDLAARPGKYPVAYTTFGGRQPVEPWVFASYLSGGFDNLAELLHETGHAIHIAGIHTRPAFLEWPDNDTYSEALADVPALEIYEPRWQWRFLGDSVPLAESLRARYAAIAFDMTWSLFELRAYRDPDVDPNQLWCDLAERFLGIRRHPEWSWWAMRGQLIDAPGYLLNYALGAFIAADIRARLAAAGNGFSRSDQTLYDRLRAALYQPGRSEPARQVLERFLGRPISPDALLADLARITRD